MGAEERKQESVERRRGRRAHFEAPVMIRRVGEQGTASPFTTQLAKNVSLAGVYFETDEAEPLKMHEVVVTSVSVPESKRRDFPFTRLAGVSRVVRVTDLSPGEAGNKRFGIALEFGNDMTALTATPTRG